MTAEQKAAEEKVIAMSDGEFEEAVISGDPPLHIVLRNIRLHKEAALLLLEDVYVHLVNNGYPFGFIKVYQAVTGINPHILRLLSGENAVH